jgi:hypothetical protein
MAYRNVHFYNHYGAGDIFISREFVKEICNKIPAENYYYAHAKNKRILADMPFLQWEAITDKHVMRSYFRPAGEDLYINTWMGVTSKYVTPANSCSINNAYRMYNDILRALGYETLLQNSLGYIPQPIFGFGNFQLDGVIEFIGNIKDFILIDNCFVQSNQAKNFDFTPIIDRLAGDFPDKAFVTTMQTDIIRDNVFFSGLITKTDDGFDLNEISFLSQFTNTIIGRSSGPMVFCMTKENCYNQNKLFLSFTYRPEAAHIVDQGIKIPAKTAWGDAKNEDDVVSIISNVIERGTDE